MYQTPLTNTATGARLTQIAHNLGFFYCLTCFDKAAERPLDRVRGGRSALWALGVEAEAFPAPWPPSGQLSIM
jgi:hypothetical protein